jgi:hypothetical protein
MTAIQEELMDWVEHYIKNRDLIAKQVVNIMRHEEGWSLRVVKQQGQQWYLVEPHLENAESITSRMKEETDACLVVLNTKKNVDVIATHWKDLVKYPKLCIIFVNPNSETDKRWIIFPHSHHKIIEPKTLKKGLQSLYNTVEPYKEVQ